MSHMLSRFERIGWELWLAPAVAAAVWGTLVASAGSELPLARTIVFVGGPLVLLAGLFERLGAYLHAPHRHTLLPLPLHPDLHFEAAARPHRVGLLGTAALGTSALLVAAVSELLPAGAPVGGVALLVADWLWLVLLAALVEPAIAGVSAWLGRRFDDDSAPRRLQLQAGGGWTLPEAVVHLYAPALGIGVAALLAMPGQLTLDRIADAGAVGSVSAGLSAAGLVPPALAVALRAWARRGYAAGMFQAVAWLAQATRTLAGPPIPEPAPRWVSRISDPSLRLWALQLWRVTPVPGLRLWALIGVGGWIGWTATLRVPQAAILLALLALWLVPAVRVAKLRPGRRAFFAALPLAERPRSGACPSGALLLAVPAIVAIGLAAGGTLLQGGA